jgi:hypothetical protein
MHRLVATATLAALVASAAAAADLKIAIAPAEQISQPRPQEQRCTVTLPAAVNAHCCDGWYNHGITREGACSRHGGVAEWVVRRDGDTCPSLEKSRQACPAPAR